ncbi:MAG: cbb3-type cytochrome c oxidase subunit I [Burkholderiales bacterium]|nr:cbb3-type cytochrome c oxidase subunit I [Burkholderiales bacterium]
MNPIRVSSSAIAVAGGRALWADTRAPDYALAAPRDARRTLAIAWLVLATLALAAAGAFSLLLVAARTPQLMHLFPTFDFFRVALVVHVDLSVLVWFFAIAGTLWSLNGSTRFIALGWGALGITALGAALMAAAPFLAPGHAIMSNYVPVIDNAPFLSGLVVFAFGAAACTLRGLAAVRPVGTIIDGAAALRFGLNVAAVAAAMALLAFAWSYLALPAGLPRASYFEVLFWGGGHVLQFLYTLLMLVAWLALATACGGRVPLSARVAIVMFAIAAAAVFATPAIYLAYEVTSGEHRRVMTWLMRVAGGFAIVPVAAAVAIALARAPRLRASAPMRAALIASLLLFGAGGIMGFAIEGSNTRIPAHYHGCIVGVTLALMGLVYALLPRLGSAPLPRSAALQPYVYGIGQLMHIVGLMWSGGYGVQRKVAGAEQALKSGSEMFGMGLMGAGGLLAIVGGFMFVAIVARCAWQRPRVGMNRAHDR